MIGWNPSVYQKDIGGTGQDKSRFPVEKVSWFDAVEFCLKLSEKEHRQPCYHLTNIVRDQKSIRQANVEFLAGDGYRLPREAEWEFACRAGSQTTYSFGDDASRLGDCSWYRKNAYDIGELYAHRVGQKQPNAWGMYDMHGNVFEWCQDEYDPQAYSNRTGISIDPLPPEMGRSRVYRGGCWNKVPGYSRLAYRDGPFSSQRDYDTGFRVVCAAGPRANEGSGGRGVPWH